MAQPKGRAEGEDRDRCVRMGFLRTALSGSLAILILMGCARAQEASEYQIKAAYIYNFAKSAQWPPSLLPDGTAPLVIGVLGGDVEFVNVLTGIVSGKSIGTHSIAVKHHNGADDVKCCNVVFFRASERQSTRAAIASLNSGNVLLVGEDPAFLGDGGTINLVMARGKIQFEVAQDALDRSSIQFSSKFLSLAKAHPDANQQAEGPRQLRVKIAPEYPTIAKQMNLKGAAQVEATIGRDGTVTDVRVLGGHPLLVDALVRAVKQWKYQPAAKDSTELIRYSFEPQ